MKNGLKKYQRILSPGDPERSERLMEDEEEEQGGSVSEALLEITQHFLRRMQHEELADCLQGGMRMSTCTVGPDHTV